MGYKNDTCLVGNETEAVSIVKIRLKESKATIAKEFLPVSASHS